MKDKSIKEDTQMNEEEIRIIKTTPCLSLSERSTLTYEIGFKSDSLYVHLSGNSEKGLFCKEWISMETIHQLLSANETITSKSLKSLYSGRNVNSPGFLLSVLKLGEMKRRICGDRKTVSRNRQV